MALKPLTERKLEALIDALGVGSVNHDELIEALEGIVGIVNQSKELLTSQIAETSSGSKQEIEALKRALGTATDELASFVREVKSKSDMDADDIRQLIAKELQRVEARIPVLPPEFDATELHDSLEEHKTILANLSQLIVGENIRNALESLPEGEKLLIEAIQDLPEKLKDLEVRMAQRRDTTALIARRMDQIGDLILSDTLNNNTIIQYNATTRRWFNGISITVSDTEPTDPKENDLWVQTV